MPPIFTNNYYINGLRDWCTNCTAQDLANCSINNHTTRKVLFVGDINREWIAANIKPTYECAYISRVIESLLYIRLAKPKELENLLLSDAEDAVLRQVEYLTLSTRSNAKAPKCMGEVVDMDMDKKVPAEEMDELNRVQYLIATDYLLEARQDGDSDIKLENPSDHHNPPRNCHDDDDDDDDDDDKDYISLEDTSCDNPDNQNNNKNNENSNKDKGKDRKHDNQELIPDSGINIDSDMWRLQSIRLLFEVMHKRHRKFPEEPKIHVSFTKHYLRKVVTIQKFNAYTTVEFSKAPPRPIMETFVPGFSTKHGHKQKRKRLRMDISGGSESGQGSLEEVCKLFQERILKKEEEERWEREIALMRKWKHTTSGHDREDDGNDDESGGDDEDEESDQLGEDYGYEDIRPKDEKGDLNLEQSYHGMKRLRLEEDDDDDDNCDDQDL
ncbi:hypothetical protein BGZ93_007590 [Podila epicladia]|nr:hypothetical protein BGZ92_007266 [Podila epicladia]KAG0094009.1 hypothetical protein BGZ93_007590 [Podila epicladia]